MPQAVAEFKRSHPARGWIFKHPLEVCVEDANEVWHSPFAQTRSAGEPGRTPGFAEEAGSLKFDAVTRGHRANLR
jgi:hypothetical protein